MTYQIIQNPRKAQVSGPPYGHSILPQYTQMFPVGGAPYHGQILPQYQTVYSTGAYDMSRYQSVRGDDLAPIDADADATKRMGLLFGALAIAGLLFWINFKK